MIMGQNATRSPTEEEMAHVASTLKSLREHFREWKCAPGGEHDLVAFAYYEGCGGTDHCGDLLADAAPIALGQELVLKHGFHWTMIQTSAGWRYAVEHPAIDCPIDLFGLEDGSWNNEDYDEPPSPGQTTNESLEYIVDRVGSGTQSSDNNAVNRSGRERVN